MAAYADFSELKTGVENWVSRTDFPVSIYSLATARINRKLRAREMISAYSASATAETVALPADFLEFETVYIDQDPRIELSATDSFVQSVHYRSSGLPTTYSVRGSTLYLNPIPDGTYALAGTYYAELSDFSADSDTNTVLTTYPDMYLAACLHFVYLWDQDQENAGFWMQAFDGLVSEINQFTAMSRYSGNLRMSARVTA